MLYNPNPLSEHRLSVQAPLALLAVAGLLDQEGYEIKIISSSLSKDPVSEVLSSCVDAICLGISSMTGYQILDGLHVARTVKKKYPTLPIVWGSWHPSLEPEQTLESPYVDIVIRGQGERSLTELVHAIERKKPLKGILGVSYKENGKIIHNPERPIEDINSFPPLPFHLIDVKKYLYNTEYGHRVINYISSYGCPFRCRFCEVQTIYKRRWSGLKAERMLDDIKHLVDKFGVDGVAFHDNSFFISKERVRKFCQGLIDRKIKIGWYAYGGTRELLRYEDNLWHLMKKSGLHGILIGAESGYPKMLDFIQKDATVEDTINFAKKCEKHDIKIVFSFFVGVPWDPNMKKTKALVRKEFEHTIKLIDKIVSMNRRHRIILSFYTPYPGSPLYSESLKCGFRPPESLEEWGDFRLEWNTTPWIPAELGRMIEYLSTYVFMFLDLESYNWITDRIRNKMFRVLFKFVFKMFENIVLFRWKHKFFRLPVDYKIYQFVRNHSRLLNVFGFYES